MLRLKRSICWVYLTVFTQAGFAMYCEKEFSPRNVTGRVLSFCTINMKHDTVAIYLEVSGLEKHGITCSCTLALVDENTKSNLGYELVQETIDGSEIRVGNVVAPPNLSAPISMIDELYNTTLTFSKTTGTSKMCLRIVSGARFNVDCQEPVYQSSEPTTSTTVTNDATTQTTTITTTDGNDSKNNPRGGPKRRVSSDTNGDIPVIAGAAGGGFVVIIAIIITVILCKRKRNPSTPPTRQTKEPQGESNYYLTDNANYVSADAVSGRKSGETNNVDTEMPEYATPVKGIHTPQAGTNNTDYAHYTSPRDTYMDTNDLETTRDIQSGSDVGYDTAGYAVVNQDQIEPSGSNSYTATVGGNNYNHLNEVINKQEPQNIYNTIT